MTRVRRWLPPVFGSFAGCLAILSILALLPALPPSKTVPGIGPSKKVSLIEDGDWTVAVLADIQNGFAYLPEIFRRVAKHKADFVIVLGDVSSREDRDHHWLPAKMMSDHPSPAPLFVVPGNHDVRGDRGLPEYLQWYGSTTFDLTVGRTRFLGVNNADGPLGDAALSDLEALMLEAGEQGQRVVLCMHRSVIDAEEANRKTLELIERRQVVLVLAGHSHQVRDELRGKTRFVVVPPSGDKSHDTGETPISFGILRWAADGFDLKTEKFPRDGSTEFRGVYLHVMLSHFRPVFEDYPALYLLFLGLAVAGCGMGWRFWFIARRRGAEDLPPSGLPRAAAGS